MKRRAVLVLIAGLARAQTQPALPAAIQNPFRFSPPGSVIAAAFDRAGNLYVAGTVYDGVEYYKGAPSSVVTQLGPGGGFADSYVMKVSPAQQVMYVTGIGGSGFDDVAAMAVDPNGNVFLAGSTDSNNFPTTSGAFEPASATGGGFVLKLDPSGKKLIYSTYLDHTGTYIYALTIDGSGNAYVGGSPRNVTFPTTEGVYQSSVAPFHQAWRAATAL